MTVVSPTTFEPRLLVAGDPGLASHVQTYGPLPERTNDDLWSELQASGLTGRGGGGFPTWRKWESVRKAKGRAVVVVNVMEGEPMSGKDRVLVTFSPHLVLDGAELAARVLGASSIRICVAEDQNGPFEALERALGERPRTMATLERLPARYITGEESSLVHWLEDGDARPMFRMDKSTPLRIGRQSVLVQNAETMAQVALVARYGANWFRSLGTAESPGTSLFTIAGAVRTPGVIEAPMGTPIRSLLELAGGTTGVEGMLIGGYGGGWLGREHLDVPYAPASLRGVGVSHGVGMVVALGPDSCGIAEMARVARYMAGQGAGQCGPCVFGLPALADDLDQLWSGRVGNAWSRRMVRHLEQVERRGACGHPDGVVRMIRTGLDVFSADVARHGAGRPCAAHRSPSVMRTPQ